jgi:hypothetical protein
VSRWVTGVCASGGSRSNNGAWRSKVRPPRNRHGEREDFLEIRVGIHCGDITCGVLGKLQPRFQVFGSAVNMAARMEQSGAPSQVHVSRDFFETVDLPETVWCHRKRVTVKNMGEVETYYHDPLGSHVRANTGDGGVEGQAKESGTAVLAEVGGACEIGSEVGGKETQPWKAGEDRRLARIEAMLVSLGQKIEDNRSAERNGKLDRIESALKSLESRWPLPVQHRAPDPGEGSGGNLEEGRRSDGEVNNSARNQARDGGSLMDDMPCLDTK